MSQQTASETMREESGLNTAWLLRITGEHTITSLRRGRALAGLLLMLVVILGLSLLLDLVIQVGIPVPGWQLALGLGVTLLLYLGNRQGYTSVAGGIASVMLLAIALLAIRETGPLSIFAALLVLPVILSGLFAPSWLGILVALAAGLGYLFLNMETNTRYFADIQAGRSASQSVLMYLNLAVVAGITWVFAQTNRQAMDDSETLSLALVTQREVMGAQLAARTRELQATITIARAIAGTRNLEALLAETVRLIRETFGYYHVQVFMIDEGRQYAVLHQSTGEVGQELLSRGHRLPVGSLSVIGQVTASLTSVVARDTDSAFVHRRNELLPNTRSEMALPLMVGDELIGALDLQSVSADAFEEETLPTLQALADQLAVAIQNARLFEQAEANIRELSELSGRATQQSWREFLALSGEEDVRQIYGAEPKALATQRSTVMDQVLKAGAVSYATGADGSMAYLAVPIVVRSEVVGVLGIEPEGSRDWTQDDLALMQGIAERTALAVENARLYMDARRAAERERMVGDIVERLQRAPNLALLLQGAARELSEALGTRNVYAELNVERPLAEQRREVSEENE